MQDLVNRPEALLFALSAAATFLIATALLLYERFAPASRRYFLFSTLVAAWLAGIAVHAADPASPSGIVWLRWAFVAHAFAGPALYWLVLLLTRSRRPRLQTVLWLGGTAFGLLGVAGDTLILAVNDLLLGRATGRAALGGVFYLFVLACVAGAVVELARGWRRASSPEERRRHGTLLAALAVGALAFVDVLLPWIGVDIPPLTPVFLMAMTAVAGVAASRYRAFAGVPAFATEEILRTMSDAVLVLDAAGRVRGSNQAARDLTRRDEQELLGLDGAELFVAPGGRRVTTRVRPGDRWRDRELLIRRSGGTAAEVSVSAEPLTAGGEVVGSVLVARDIRERLRAERELEATELRYRSLFWHNPAPAYELDLEGRFLNVNPAATAMLGREAEELIGRPYTDVMEPRHTEAARAAFLAVLEGEATQYEVAISGPGGERRSIRGVSIPVWRDGQVQAVFGMALDVTEEVRAKHELEVQRSYFAALFDGAPEPILLTTRDGRILQVNVEFTRVFGYSLEECVGQSVRDLVVPPDLREESDQLIARAASGETARAESVRLRKDGTPVDVSILARELVVPGQEPQIYGIYRDISDRKRTERALREREEELRHAQKLEAVGKLAGGVAHDFNNLVTVINGHARLALDAVGDAPVRPDLEEIERAGARAAALTQQLLAFSRRQVLRPQVLDVNAVVRDMDLMISRLMGEHVDLDIRLAEDAGRVFVDRGQLEQVLINLVVNARDAMPAGGRLTLRSEAATLPPDHPLLASWEIRPGRYVRLVVEDTGIGMDAATMARAFEPFFTTKERGKGTGLGLATVFGIVKQSGGHIVPASTPGSGSRFHVYLPAVDDEVQPADDAVGATGNGVPATCGPRTILVVEDEPAVRELAARVLKREGHNVLTAADGQEALGMMERMETAPDLIVSDLVMPRMGGRELVARVRRSRPGVRVLLMSGYDEEMVHTDDEGPLLSKPFTPAALADRVARLLV